MGREEVAICAGRGLLYAGKPTYRKAAPSKTTNPAGWLDEEAIKSGLSHLKCKMRLSLGKRTKRMAEIAVHLYHYQLIAYSPPTASLLLVLMFFIQPSHTILGN